MGNSLSLEKDEKNKRIKTQNRVSHCKKATIENGLSSFHLVIQITKVKWNKLIEDKEH